MLKTLQARLQQYMNYELLDVQAEFRKCRGTRDQIANICWIIQKEREENNRMGNTKDLFKKIRDTKGTFHARAQQRTEMV